jgi:hypothetical protein
MLKNPRTSFLGMAFETDIVIKFVPFLQAGPCPGPVRCMTVRALQCSLNDPVVVRKIELGLNVRVARETEVVLLSLQEVFGNVESMDLMAVITPDRT